MKICHFKSERSTVRVTQRVVEITFLTVLTDRQYKKNVTLMCLTVTIIFVHKQELLHFLSVSLQP
jgi:hypothetical protein